MITSRSAVEQAERGVIGCLFTDPSRCVPLAVNNAVAEDWFTVPMCQLMWAACMALWREKNADAIDAVLAFERARRLTMEKNSPWSAVSVTPADVERIIEDTPSTIRFEYYIALLRSEVMMRRVGAAQAAFHKDVAAGSDVEWCVTRFNDRIAHVLSSSMAARSTTPAALVERIMQDYADARRRKLDKSAPDYDPDFTPGLPLPWKVFNQKSNGVQEGLYYIGARPSIGKTALVLNIMRFWCEKGYNVAFDSLDMAGRQLMKRPIGELSRVSFNKASFGTTSAADMDAMTRAAGEISRWPMTIIEERDVDVLRSWCVAMKAVNRLDVLVIDFVGLLNATRRFSNSEERIEYVSGVLKSIAISLNIPVLALSQLNRECEKDGGRIPTASDLRGSGALEADAFAVWILHRDRDVAETWWKDNGARLPVGLTPSASKDEFSGIDPVRLIIAKNQNGQAGPDIWLPFVFYKKYCCWMLGDYAAAGVSVSTGYGVSKKDSVDYSPKYARVHSDWRRDPLESALRKNGTLIEQAASQGGMGL